VPDGPILAVANEFFDALPVEQLVRTQRGWSSRVVDVARDGSGLMFRMDDAAEVPCRLPAAANGAPVGAILEISPRREETARALAAGIARDGGAALVVDYGHARSAAGETLQGVARHGYADVMAAPGETDLSAHVDFEALAAAASGAGARIFGPVPQGEFLTRLGLPYRVARLVASAPNGAAAGKVRAGATRLIDPAGLGLLFKAMAFTPPSLPAPPGFDFDRPEDTSPP
jgi:NADH dehydrogenase [ubiquinone] 1 alpha subcomplex assembly factor 7